MANFGRHKGRSFKEIAEMDMQYLRWAVRETHTHGGVHWQLVQMTATKPNADDVFTAGVGSQGLRPARGLTTKEPQGGAREQLEQQHHEPGAYPDLPCLEERSACHEGGSVRRSGWLQEPLKVGHAADFGREVKRCRDMPHLTTRIQFLGTMLLRMVLDQCACVLLLQPGGKGAHLGRRREHGLCKFWGSCACIIVLRSPGALTPRSSCGGPL